MTAVDYPTRSKRFELVYNFFKCRIHSRIGVKSVTPVLQSTGQALLHKAYQLDRHFPRGPLYLSVQHKFLRWHLCVFLGPEEHQLAGVQLDVMEAEVTAFIAFGPGIQAASSRPLAAANSSRCWLSVL